MFCKYKHIFGKEGEGLHSYRIMNIAIVDLLFTIIGGILLCWFFPKTSCTLNIVGLLITGIILHHLFCVRTTIDRILFP